MKSPLTVKDPDTEKGWGQEEKWVAEDEMARLQHRLKGMNLSKLWEIVKNGETGVLQSLDCKELDTHLVTEQQ